MLLVFIMLAGCGSQPEDEETKQETPEKTENQSESTDSTSDQTKFEQESPFVTITMEDGDEIKIELYPDIAPNTVNNFISLAENSFYDGLIFHRVIPDFMIQGGDPEGNGKGGPGYTIKGEFDSNGVSNDLKHKRGVISMARSSDPDSAGSQFFIVVSDSPSLNGDYAAFGQVIEGMDTVDEIASVKRDANDKPKKDQKMKKIEVDTKGKKFPDPETIE